MKEQAHKSTNLGVIPTEGELWNLTNGKPLDIDLRGQDSLAWDYAMLTSANPNAGSIKAGSGLKASLEALMNAPEPDELTDEEFEDVEPILDEWYEKYGNSSIADAVVMLASTILETLGIEWV